MPGLARLGWLAAGLAGLAAGCGSFQDPNVVVDLRVLAIRSEPPDQVVDIDLTRPVNPAELFAQLVPTEVCALIADPTLDRRLAWSMTVCPLGGDDRCDGTQLALAGGLVDDPDTTVPEPQLCATIQPDAGLLGLLADEIQGDALHGLGGVYYGVVLRVGGEDADRDLDQYAAKSLRISPRIPMAFSANHNPTLERFDAMLEDGDPVTLPLGRCPENPAPYVLRPATKLRILPVESADTREAYVLPTLDGHAESFTESPTYQWIAGAGGYSAGSTGGPHDLAGNPAPLFSDYKSPSAEELGGPTNVSLWIIQRDERLGVHWYESCIRVMK
jgi:hypothetical protein